MTRHARRTVRTTLTAAGIAALGIGLAAPALAAAPSLADMPVNAEVSPVEDAAARVPAAGEATDLFRLEPPTVDEEGVATADPQDAGEAPAAAEGADAETLPAAPDGEEGDTEDGPEDGTEAGEAGEAAAPPAAEGGTEGTDAGERSAAPREDPASDVLGATGLQQVVGGGLPGTRGGPLG